MNKINRILIPLGNVSIEYKVGVNCDKIECTYEFTGVKSYDIILDNVLIIHVNQYVPVILDFTEPKPVKSCGERHGKDNDKCKQCNHGDPETGYLGEPSLDHFFCDWCSKENGSKEFKQRGAIK